MEMGDQLAVQLQNCLLQISQLKEDIAFINNRMSSLPQFSASSEEREVEGGQVTPLLRALSSVNQRLSSLEKRAANNS